MIRVDNICLEWWLNDHTKWTNYFNISAIYKLLIHIAPVHMHILAKVLFLILLSNLKLLEVISVTSTQMR